MLRGFVLAAVFEADEGVFSERHQVREQKAIGGFYLVQFVLGLLGAPRAGGVACKRQRHVLPAPVIAAAAPFLSARALGLRGVAIVEKEARVAFEGAEDGAI